MVEYQSIITINSQIRSAKPTVRGMQICLYDFFNMLANKMSFAKLTEEDILAALSYAADKEHEVSICV
jgi:uncharacterized protein (DUF433 family)